MIRTNFDTRTELSHIVYNISKHACRNADWDNGIKKSDLPTGGAIHPDDSVITDKDFKNIQVLGKGVSPLSFIKNLIKSEEGE